LINDGLAVAIQYGTTRTFPEEPQYHLIYDMGAGSTTATVVSFRSRSVKEGRTNKTVIEIATHGIGYDRELGGDLFNSRIADTLVDAFRSSKSGSKAKTDITTDGRAFARLFKEAARVKQVLSANAETMASVPPLTSELMQIESLHEDIDFRTKVTRAAFEQGTSDLVDRVTAPIVTALQDANITLEQVESVILHGGSVRVPFVQKALEDVVGDSKLAKTVNADEAAVMGMSIKIHLYRCYIPRGTIE
jgi:hypoxia up-regulated 1